MVQVVLLTIVHPDLVVELQVMLQVVYVFLLQVVVEEEEELSVLMVVQVVVQIAQVQLDQVIHLQLVHLKVILEELESDQVQARLLAVVVALELSVETLVREVRQDLVEQE